MGGTEAPAQEQSKASEIEIERMNQLLGQVEKQIAAAFEAITAIRFGLAVAGFPVTIEQCLEHPSFARAMRAQEEAKRAREMQINMQYLSDRLKLTKSSGMSGGPGGEAGGGRGGEGSYVPFDIAALQKLRKNSP
jgi:uncharacterized membrane protein YgcG